MGGEGKGNNVVSRGPIIFKQEFLTHGTFRRALREALLIVGPLFPFFSWRAAGRFHRSSVAGQIISSTHLPFPYTENKSLYSSPQYFAPPSASPDFLNLVRLFLQPVIQTNRVKAKAALDLDDKLLPGRRLLKQYYLDVRRNREPHPLLKEVARNSGFATASPAVSASTGRSSCSRAGGGRKDIGPARGSLADAPVVDGPPDTCKRSGSSTRDPEISRRFLRDPARVDPNSGGQQQSSAQQQTTTCAPPAPPAAALSSNARPRDRTPEPARGGPLFRPHSVLVGGAARPSNQHGVRPEDARREGPTTGGAPVVRAQSVKVTRTPGGPLLAGIGMIPSLPQVGTTALPGRFKPIIGGQQLLFANTEARAALGTLQSPRRLG